ncbi:MAG: AEC family transporter [Actinomycetota bacterium]|nr:AEC family transporter [Actinomycetota bacterium]MDP9481404.1 AEC family transporter [Actinomycetota bacterium]
MQSILNTALPFFALIFCGYAAGRLKLLPETAAAGVNTFVFYFALPAFLFGLMSSSPLAEVVNWRFIGAYATTSLLVFALAALGGRLLFGVGRGEAAVQGLAAVLPNTGYMGIPLISAVFGREAAIPIVVGLTLDGILLIPLGIIIIESGKGNAEGLLATALTTLTALTRNPLILSIFAGLAFSATGLDTPTPLTNFLDLLGAAAGPCALFALGATLAGRAGERLGGTAEVSYMTFAKLLGHPAVLWLTATQLFAVDPLWATAALLGAALPIAANVFIVARQYDVYVARTSSAILVSTAVSMASVSALLLLLT